MNKVILVVVIAAFALHAYQRVQAPESEPVMNEVPVHDLQVERNDSRPPASNSSQFRCDGRTRCPEMKSCAEAQFFLEKCPGTKMDGDRDGIPCEDQHCGN